MVLVTFPRDFCDRRDIDQTMTSAMMHAAPIHQKYAETGACIPNSRLTRTASVYTEPFHASNAATRMSQITTNERGINLGLTGFGLCFTNYLG